ncbi:CPBP family intramembrane metalloprotease [Ktedonosporobacter rubrisoli]|uniref:CPBP family intramembrane metalloprotease n=1 Tax=Ktedonosporobacter rubrisoli TaxID=2509675 RepID=A0A4P6JK26_KTERU|nr:CPBP family glutamic-type intramembrane protease [Ktedonosporobacter rubrisoli]QBD75495.1 CPBP family intramembrane metalloprotease [Ktedonosporobacter rubrisoli]
MTFSQAHKQDNILKRYPLTSFFILAYVITWVLWLPYVLLDLPKPAAIPGVLLGVTGSAFLMTYITEGKAAALRLLRRYIQWRENWFLYIFALLGFPLMLILGTVLQPAAQADLNGFSLAWLQYYPPAFITVFCYGPLLEEAGWRGFALPRLQQRYGPLRASLILGLLWGLWHLPIHLGDFQEGLGPGLLSFGFFVIAVVGLACIFTWLFNRVNGSLLIMILAHASFNALSTFFGLLIIHKGVPPSIEDAFGTSQLLIGLAFAILLIVLTRAQLAYRTNWQA